MALSSQPHCSSQRSTTGSEELLSQAKETSPLVPKQDGQDQTSCRKSLLSFQGFGHLLERVKALNDGPVVDSMTYRTRYLTTWTIFRLKGVSTAMSDASTWSVMLRLVLLSLAVATLSFSLVEHPQKVKSSKFHSISDFLRIFVGLLLSFFMSSSLNRWHECTLGFMELFDAIRCLHMQLTSMGVRSDLALQCIRYGVTSAWLVRRTLQIEQHAQEGTDEEHSERLSRFWGQLVVDDDMLETGLGPEDLMDSSKEEALPGQGYIRLGASEVATLKNVRDPACMLWIWVSSLLTRMSQDGELPGMHAPTYCRVMKLVEAAHCGIRHIRQSMSVQTPFTYVHMVALLVHINGIASAISFGLVLGCFVDTEIGFIRGLHTSRKDSIRDLENLLLSFILSLVGAFLYHVLFVTCIHITQPFTYKDSEIPTDRLLMTLQRDLLDAKMMACHPPSWEPPSFQPRAASKQ